MRFEAAPGTEVSGYRLTSEVGRGGTATVWLAEHPGLGRRVALKILAPELTEDEAFRTRFAREAHLAAALEHPNILPVFDAGEWEGLLYIAMRYVDGTDLAAEIQRYGPLDVERGVSLMSQVAAALDAAHAGGLVHRDVKPGNILIHPGAGPGGTDHAYLADFGLARGTLEYSDLTKAGEVYGTFAYMAPEQFSGGVVDARSDIYALASTTYECLTGEAPFRRETIVATIAAHLNDDPLAPSRIRPRVASRAGSSAVTGSRKGQGGAVPISGRDGSRPLEGGTDAPASHEFGDPADRALSRWSRNGCLGRLRRTPPVSDRGTRTRPK